MFEEASSSLQSTAKSLGAQDKSGLFNKGVSTINSTLSAKKNKYISDLMGSVKNSSLIKRSMRNIFDVDGLGADADINTFLSKFPDLARSNLFQISIEQPTKLIKLKEDFLQLKYFCKSVNVPFLTFTESKVKYNMRSYSVVDGSDIDPITMAFSLPANNKVINCFLEWYNIIQDIESKHYGYKSDYESIIQIAMFNRDTSEIFSAYLLGAYPASISGLDLSYESSDTLAEISVTFNYDEIMYDIADIKSSLFNIF